MDAFIIKHITTTLLIRLQEDSNEVMFNDDDVTQIVDLGFTDEQAKAALVANNYSLNSAIEWILAGHHNGSGGSGGGHRNRPRRRRGSCLLCQIIFVSVVSPQVNIYR